MVSEPIVGCYSPPKIVLQVRHQVWEKLSELFGKTDEMRGHQIENELISLSPNSFESLQLYFSKFKALVLQLKQCGI